TDLAKFINALFTGKLVSKDSLRQMSTVVDHKFGMGLIPAEYVQKTWLGHTGAIDEYRSAMAYNSDDHVAIALCSNGHVFPIERILDRTLLMYYKLPSDNFQFMEDLVEGARHLYDKLPANKLRYFDATIAGIPGRRENITLLNGGPVVAPDNGSAGSGAD